MRSCLGNPYKIRQREGAVDINGIVIDSSQVGICYVCWKALHRFCGAEGAASFMIRPSFKTPVVDRFGFKITDKTVMIDH